MPSRPKLELAGALGHLAADKRLEILRRVAEVGSISQAARDAGVSYKAAWQALDTLSNLAGTVLVERAVGGAGGGGARLSAAGQEVLRAAGELAAAREAVIRRLRTPTALAGVALRTSMRNQLPCTVHGWRPRQGAVEVRLVLAGGATLLARVTRESVQLLGLAAGQPVLALCKATAVQVLAAPVPGAARLHALSGTVTRAPGARSAGEVALQLDGGLQLVGFAAAASGLHAGSQVLALIDPAAVVIALTA